MIKFGNKQEGVSENVETCIMSLTVCDCRLILIQRLKKMYGK
jgi:hypothetical protein